LQITWTASAADDLARIRTYIGAFNPQAARGLGNDLLSAAESLVSFPDRGRPIGQGRRELVAVWPYVIRYASPATRC
jgi:toxin ParE1/3/4